MQALDVVEHQLLLGGQHLDVGIDRGRIVASEPASERVCGFGFHYQLPFSNRLVNLVDPTPDVEYVTVRRDGAGHERT
jgi:hypothetical protein